MDSGVRADVELNVRRLCETGAYDAATTEALRAYGSEILRFQCALHKNEADGTDAFSHFAEDLWRSMKTFAWACSLRTWGYTLARRASFRAMRKKPAHPPATPSAISALVQEVRTETLDYLRTETKSKIRALRDSLADDERTLLMLRVDRGLSWDELARVLAEGELDTPTLVRDAARLRKRFQLVKEKLKDLAKSEGIFPAGDDR